MIIANEKNKKTRNGKLKTIKQRYDQVSHHDSIIPFYKFHVRRKGFLVFAILSNNIQVLSPNKGALCERKGLSVEKTPFFEVFHKSLSYKQLQRFLSVISQFTKSKSARA